MILSKLCPSKTSDQTDDTTESKFTESKSQSTAVLSTENNADKTQGLAGKNSSSTTCLTPSREDLQSVTPGAECEKATPEHPQQATSEYVEDEPEIVGAEIGSIGRPSTPSAQQAPCCHVEPVVFIRRMDSESESSSDTCTLGKRRDWKDTLESASQESDMGEPSRHRSRRVRFASMQDTMDGLGYLSAEDFGNSGRAMLVRECIAALLDTFAFIGLIAGIFLIVDDYATRQTPNANATETGTTVEPARLRVGSSGGIVIGLSVLAVILGIVVSKGQRDILRRLFRRRHVRYLEPVEWRPT